MFWIRPSSHEIVNKGKEIVTGVIDSAGKLVEKVNPLKTGLVP